MEIKGWQYYNHAAIPTCGPHEKVDLTSIKNGNIWKIDGGKPLLVRYTENFDCGYETNFWYCIRKAPYNINDVSCRERSHINNSVKKSYAKIISPLKEFNALCNCFEEAIKKYKKCDYEFSRDDFLKRVKHDLNNSNLDYWGVYDFEDNKLIGFGILERKENFVSFLTAKFNLQYSNKRPSDTLYHTILTYYLNEKHFLYVNSGTRNINHLTGTQEYKERRFGYIKAYCDLKIIYRFPINFLIKLLFPFRRFFGKIDNNILFHQIYSILKMEELRRKNK